MACTGEISSQDCPHVQAAQTRREDGANSVTNAGVEYLFFVLKQRVIDTCTKAAEYKETFVIIQNIEPFDIWNFREYLSINYNISKGTPICYVNSSGNDVPMYSQNDFQEAWAFAKYCSKLNEEVVLLIDSMEQPEKCTMTSDTTKKTLKVQNENVSITNPVSSICTSEKVTVPHGTQGDKVESESSGSKCESISSMSIIPKKKRKSVTTRKVTESLKKLNFNEWAEKSNATFSSENCPPEWFKEYMNAMKKDIVEEVTRKVTTNMEILNKPTVEASGSTQVNQVKGHSHSKEKKRSKKEKKGIEEVDINIMPSELRKSKQFLRFKTMKERERKLQTKLDYKLERLKEKINTIVEKKRRYQHFAELLNNFDKESNEHDERNVDQTPIQDTVFKHISDAKSAMLNDSDQKCNDSDVPKNIKSKFRVNCSINGHEILNEGYPKGAMFCSGSDIDNISTCSDWSNGSDIHEENFEVILMPSKCESNSSNCNKKSCEIHIVENSYPSTLISDNEKLNKCEGNEINTDSPSYELLSEAPSPIIFICADDGQFSECGNNDTILNTVSDTKSLNSDDLNCKITDPLIIDSNGKIYNTFISSKADEHTSLNLNKRSAGTYSFVAETLPVQSKEEICPLSKPADKYEYDPQNNINDECAQSTSSMKSEKISSASSEASHSSQSQSDFELSFHSHMTTVTNSDIYSSKEASGSVNNNFAKQSGTDPNRNNECKDDQPKSQNDKTNLTTGVNINKKDETRHHRAENINDSSSRQSRNYTNTSRSTEEQYNEIPDPLNVIPETIVKSANHVACLFKAIHKVLDEFQTHARDGPLN